jgi:1-deoxy-D-xylulose 5-phosphate reductoisomerase
LNAANEEAVSSFLAGFIRLTDIPRVIERVLDAHVRREVTDLDVVLSADEWARAAALREITALSSNDLSRPAIARVE